MKSTVETLSPTRVRLAVEVPFDELQPSLSRAYKQIAGQINIPGFRKGKAPARIIDQRVGRASVLQEAVQHAIPRAYSDAVSSNEVNVLGQPDIELTKLEDGELLAFTAEVDVRPTITLPDLSTLTVTADELSVTDEDVEQQITTLREQYAVLTAADRPVATGDYVSIDLKATVNGEELPDGTTSGLSHEVGDGSLMPGLDDALVGMNAGDQKTFQTDLVAGSHAGETADVTVTVRSVKEKELPELDDEFAQTSSEFDTLDELRADIRERLDRVRALERAAKARDKVLEALLAAVDVPVPDSALEAESEWRRRSIEQQLAGAQVSLEEFLEREDQSRDEFDESIRTGATEAVKSQLVLDAVADAEQIGVEDAELTEHIVTQAQRYGVPPQEFAQQMVNAGNVPALVADVRRNKALLAVADQATVTDPAGAPIDFSVLRRPLPGIDIDAGTESTEAEETTGTSDTSDTTD